MNAIDARVRGPGITAIELQRGCPLDRFADWLGDVPVQVIRPYAGDPVPTAVDGGLIVLGGQLSPYDDMLAPWLSDVRQTLAAAVAVTLPVMGICLGAQLLAVACGGDVDVAAAPGLESGVVNVNWRASAAADPLLHGLPDPCPAPSMHADAVSRLPAEADWLASSDMYPYQAFRVGKAAWGVQFHPEVSPTAFLSWAGEHPEIDTDAVLAEFVARDRDVAAIGRLLARRFTDMCVANP